MSSSDKFSAEEMSSKNVDKPVFRWGKKKGVGLKDKGVQFYESFTYDDVEYALYDCVFLYDEQRKDDPHIGMLVKIWETARSSRKIKVQWFFRASEISHWLRKYKLNALDNELFFATGDGAGLENINPVEAIAGKCSIICISVDSRNPQPSADHLHMADYVFYRTFDVGKYVISEKLGDKVGGLEVKYMFNQHNIEMITGPKILPIPNEKHDVTSVAFEEAVQLSDKNGSIGGCGGEKPEDASQSIKVRKYSDKDPNLDGVPFKKPRLEGSVPWSRVEKISPLDKGPKISIKGLALAPIKEDPVGRKGGLVGGSLKAKLVVGKIYDITQRPSKEKGKWFNSNPWDLDSMRCAQDERRVILVENLSPRYTSRDVEDILWSAFQVNCTAKVVQRTAFSSSLYGQALAILKTQDAAERVVGKLNEECLLISGKRALTACIVNLPKLKLNRKKCNFVGHLAIDRIKLYREQKDARATSHHSQANTIEYELALEWCLLQSRHELAWKKLHKCHAAELSKCVANLKATARGAT